jgi:hypothetical protein
MLCHVMKPSSPSSRRSCYRERGHRYRSVLLIVVVGRMTTVKLEHSKQVKRHILDACRLLELGTRGGLVGTS